ncbi:phenol hydroxylase subunit P4 [Zhongshania marina]|uniref:Phenol hydroxylase n=1 Tax=Zhongshania marina TaxID=2304603 RepID=A0A2S4HKT6_9GAMM|nr:phenol hydroxylase subunit P4 [Marortus luteolus]POP54490.1 phenol hydroxylase [Marortus luteolus]
MTVKAINPNYSGRYRDGVENFHGNQLLNICWEKHTMMGWPMCVPISPNTTFKELLDVVIPRIYSMHPQFDSVDLYKAHWSTSKGAFIPDMSKTISDHGFKHKEQIRFRTQPLSNNPHRG